VILVAKKSDPRRGQHGSKHINIANYTSAAEEKNRNYRDHNEDLDDIDEELSDELINHYETVKPGEEYYIPLSEVAETILWLGAYEPPEMNDGNNMIHDPSGNNNNINQESLHIHHHHGYHHNKHTNNSNQSSIYRGINTKNTHVNGDSKNEVDQPRGEKSAMIKSARFAQQGIPLTNLVVESSEALVYGKRKERAPMPPAGVQLSFPLSFEQGQTWNPSSRFYRVQIHRTPLDGNTHTASSSHEDHTLSSSSSHTKVKQQNNNDDDDEAVKKKSSTTNHESDNDHDNTAAATTSISDDNLNTDSVKTMERGGKLERLPEADEEPESQDSALKSRVRRMSKRSKQPKTFIPSQDFDGTKKGYVYKHKGVRGSGYYLIKTLTSTLDLPDSPTINTPPSSFEASMSSSSSFDQSSPVSTISPSNISSSSSFEIENPENNNFQKKTFGRRISRIFSPPSAKNILDLKEGRRSRAVSAPIMMKQTNHEVIIEDGENTSEDDEDEDVEDFEDTIDMSVSEDDDDDDDDDDDSEEVASYDEDEDDYDEDDDNIEEEKGNGDEGTSDISNSDSDDLSKKKHRHILTHQRSRFLSDPNENMTIDDDGGQTSENVNNVANPRKNKPSRQQRPGNMRQRKNSMLVHSR
jgi:hypothetical protein